MVARTYVTAEVDAPQFGAVELVAVYDGVACIAVKRVVGLVGGKPFHYELPFAVTVYVAHRHIIGSVGVFAHLLLAACRACAAFRAVEMDFHVRSFPHRGLI